MSKWTYGGYSPAYYGNSREGETVRLSILKDPNIYRSEERTYGKGKRKRTEWVDVCDLTPEEESARNEAYREKVRQLIRAGGNPKLLDDYLGKYDSGLHREDRIYLCDFCGDALLRERSAADSWFNPGCKNSSGTLLGDGVRLLFGDGRVCDDCCNATSGAPYESYSVGECSYDPRNLSAYSTGPTKYEFEYLDQQIMEFAAVLRRYFSPVHWERNRWHGNYIKRFDGEAWPTARICMGHSEWNIDLGFKFRSGMEGSPEDKYRNGRAILLRIGSEHKLKGIAERLRKLLPKDPHEIKDESAAIPVEQPAEQPPEQPVATSKQPALEYLFSILM